MDVLQNMANKFRNISAGKSASDEDATGITKAGSNLLLGIGNVLDASTMNTKKTEKEQAEETADEGKKPNITQVLPQQA